MDNLGQRSLSKCIKVVSKKLKQNFLKNFFLMMPLIGEGLDSIFIFLKTKDSERTATFRGLEEVESFES